MSQTTTDEQPMVRVRVWFGQFPIVDHTTACEAGTAFARAIGRRFSGLPVTVDPVASLPDGVER
ncbi:hypothetical protein [Kribbella swartbergensis]